MGDGGPAAFSRFLVRTPAGMAFVNRPAITAAPRSLPPMGAGGLSLPAELTSSWSVQRLPDVGAVDQMGAPTGVPMLSFGSSAGGLSLSASLPDLPPPRAQSQLAMTSVSGRVGKSQFNSTMSSMRSQRTADGLPMPVQTADSEYRLRRHERQLDKLNFSRRHTENWNALQPWLKEKEAKRKGAPQALLRKIKAEAAANNNPRRLGKFWEDEFEKPGWTDTSSEDPAAVEARRSGNGLTAPISVRVPPALHVDGGAHNLEWGGCTPDSLTVGWVGPYVGGELSGMRVLRLQLQHRVVGGVECAAAIFGLAQLDPHEDTTMLATAAAAEAAAWLAWAHGGNSPEAGSDAPRPNRRVQRAALWALQAAGAAASFATADAQRDDIRPSPDDLFGKAYGKGTERELRLAAAVAARAGVAAGWVFPTVHKAGRLVASKRSRQGKEQRWELVELGSTVEHNQHRLSDLKPASWVECRARAATGNGFGPWADAVLLQSQQALPLAPTLTRSEAEVPYSGAVEWYLCVSGMGGVAVEGFELEVTLQTQVFGVDSGDPASVTRAAGAAELDREIRAMNGDQNEEETPPVAIEWTIGFSAAKPVQLKMRPQLVEFTRRWVEPAADCGKSLMGRVEIGDLLPSEQYAVRLRAVNAVGPSDWSDWSRFQTLPSTEVPGPLLLLSEEVARTDISLTVRWRNPAAAPGAKPTSTTLRHRKMGATEWTQQAPLAAEGRSRRALEEAGSRGLGVLDVDAWTVSGLAFATEYEVEVRLENANGPGPWVATSAKTLEEGDMEPAHPKL